MQDEEDYELTLFGRVYEEYRKRGYRLDTRDRDGLLF